MIPVFPERSIDFVGIGFKPRYAEPLHAARRPLGWLEVHAENYMVDGGPKRALLETLAERYPISCHGVGLSIGADAPLDAAHLARLRRLEDWLRPTLFSEHLAWSSHGRNYYNDLLPLPYTDATLERVVAHLERLQDTLGRQVLLENPSSYLAFEESTWSESDFVAETARRSGCALLLDVNNVHVSATNLGFPARDYLDAFPVELVREIHVAGHRCGEDPDAPELLIDSHDAPVADRVWALYEEVLARTGPVPTLIERDAELPAFAELEREAQVAARYLASRAEAA